MKETTSNKTPLKVMTIGVIVPRYIPKSKVLAEAKSDLMGFADRYFLSPADMWACACRGSLKHPNPHCRECRGTGVYRPPSCLKRVFSGVSLVSQPIDAVLICRWLWQPSTSVNPTVKVWRKFLMQMAIIHRDDWLVRVQMDEYILKRDRHLLDLAQRQKTHALSVNQSPKSPRR